MQAFIIILIIIGAANMIINVYRYAKFLRSSQDVLSSGRKRDSFWMNLALVLLVFFLLGYVFVGLFSTPDLCSAVRDAGRCTVTSSGTPAKDSS